MAEQTAIQAGSKKYRVLVCFDGKIPKQNKCSTFAFLACSYVHRESADNQLNRLAEHMTSTFALGSQTPEAVDSTDVPQSVQGCVQSQRSGSSTQFTFTLPAPEAG
eukprot:scaffold133557_cov15-Tisochrysis_lutea.AAC.1